MGKPFAKELELLPASLAWGNELALEPFTKFVNQARGRLLVAIGAGGSYTAAELMRLLHEARGGAALAYTPLSFLQAATDLRQAFVAIFTASGNNRDVLASFEVAAAREPLGILIICGKPGSKVEVKARLCERTVIFSRRLPAGRDGYLATNSLATFCVLTLRAFGYPSIKIHTGEESLPKLPREIPQYFIALYGGWARPAAVDLESKFSETGLGSVMLADYRQFAHGRHNWIDKRGAQSAVVAFITPDTATLAKKTLALLPATMPIMKLSTRTEGPIGAIELLMDVFRLTAAVGQRVGIDPGRPGVPDYGSRIYRLGPTTEITRPAPKFSPATARKLAVRGTTGLAGDFVVVEAARRKFAAKLKASRFGALVLDFDGTVVSPGVGRGAMIPPPVIAVFEELLLNDIPLYFATGRGDSVHGVIANSIPRKYHSRVFVAYYNGSVTRALSETPPRPEGGPRHGDLEAILQRLNADPFLPQVAKPENKSYQLTLKVSGLVGFTAASLAVRELIANSPSLGFKVVESSHSLDVIPMETTKLNCVREAQSKLPNGLDLLTLGDRGAIDGNDHELLTHPFSLSVDAVSGALDSCWNLLPAGRRNVRGLLHYFGWFRIKRGSFTLNLPKEATE